MPSAARWSSSCCVTAERVGHDSVLCHADLVRLTVTDTAEAAATAAARAIARRLATAVRDRGRASVAFSGGSTPLAMFRALAGMRLAWDRIDVFQVDERCAPDGDRDRNATMLIELLIKPTGIDRRAVRLMPVTMADTAVAARRYGALVAATEPFDVVHLGLGSDGHTASWPPADTVIDAVEPVAYSGEYQGRTRMTLTPGVVNRARSRVVLAAGADKAPIIERWFAGDPALPICRVRRSATAVFIDRAAAGRSSLLDRLNG
ncbi:MAG: 6-phosphogluconolactonase [Actinomycetota bacterium]